MAHPPFDAVLTRQQVLKSSDDSRTLLTLFLADTVQPAKVFWTTSDPPMTNLSMCASGNVAIRTPMVQTLRRNHSTMRAELLDSPSPRRNLVWFFVRGSCCRAQCSCRPELHVLQLSASTNGIATPETISERDVAPCSDPRHSTGFSIP